MIKYKSMKQILEYLYKSEIVYVFYKTNCVNFCGKELDRCTLKLDRYLIDDIIQACQIFDIELIENY